MVPGSNPGGPIDSGRRRGALLVAGGALIVAAGALAGYLLAARGDEGAPPVAATTGPIAEADEAVPEGWDLCRNEVEGFAVGYPGDWHAAEGPERFACSFFDPEPVEILEGTELPFTALEAHPLDEGVSYEDVLASFTDETFERVLDQEETTVAGFPAVRVETEATGEGLAGEGTRTYAYVIDREGRAFLLRTTAPAGDDLAERREIVDAASRTLLFFPPQGEPTETIEAVPDELPPAVRGTYEALVGAAEAEDYDTLARIGDHPEFTYSLGGPAEEGPAAFWRDVERQSGESPALMLAAILALPHDVTEGVYVWPFAINRDPATLTPEELESLEPVASPEDVEAWKEFGAYLGWRTGIREDGTWLFFITGGD